MADPTATRGSVGEEFHRARHRYLHDAEFHAEVERAVGASMAAVFIRDPVAAKVARGAATDAVLLALHLRDNTGDDR